MLVVSLVHVPKLLVTGFPGEGLEEDSYKTASKGYFTMCVVELKAKGAELILGATQNIYEHYDIYDVLDLVSDHSSVLSLRLSSRALLGYVQTSRSGISLLVFSKVHVPGVY